MIERNVLREFRNRLTPLLEKFEPAQFLELLWAMDAAVEQDDKLSFGAAAPLKIKKWISRGELSGGEDVEDVYARAGRLLDKAYATEAIGTVLFEGEDGKTYTATVEVVIGEADADFVKDIMQDLEDLGEDAP